MSLRTKDPELVHGVTLSSSTLEELRRTFRGQLLTPADAGYDTARQVPNAMVDRHPALLARCLGAADVASTILCVRGPALAAAPIARRPKEMGGGPETSGPPVVRRRVMGT